MMTSTTTPTPSITLESLERIKQLIDSMPPEPIGEWMRSKGYPPESWRVILPASLLKACEPPIFWPEYVQFNPMVEDAVFVARILPLNSVVETFSP